jgi:fructose-1,6-bisphosphatase/inositol monophosphatase family enzyme
MYKEELVLAKKIALSAGKIILKYKDNQNLEIKKDKSFVTIADKMINSIVIKEISKKFPKDVIVGEEESTGTYGMGRVWICDPIDGTAAYVWGLPTSMFSLGLVVNGVPVLGVTYDPHLNLMYTGIKGGNAFCNNKKISVSNSDLKNGIIAVTGSTKHIGDYKYIKELSRRKVRLASFSGAVYKCMLIARGKLVGYVEDRLNPHDIAASQVILECAGGKVTGLNGENLDYSKVFLGVIVSNKVVHKDLVKLVKLDR